MPVAAASQCANECAPAVAHDPSSSTAVDSRAAATCNWLSCAHTDTSRSVASGPCGASTGSRTSAATSSTTAARATAGGEAPRRPAVPGAGAGASRPASPSSKVVADTGHPLVVPRQLWLPETTLPTPTDTEGLLTSHSVHLFE